MESAAVESDHEVETAPETVRPGVRLGVLLSGEGEHGMALVEAIQGGGLSGCEIAIVVSNVPGAAGVESARAAGIPAVTIEGRGREQRDHEDAIDALLRRMRVDLVCVAGYRRTLSNRFISRWPGRIFSVHSSLLPAFAHPNAVQQALAFGSQVTGCTVFLVDDSLHGGPILLQRTVPVLDEDTEATLGARLLAEERAACVEAVRRFVGGEYEVRGRRFVRRETPEE